MYYYLVGALKKRLILEIQDSFSRHPVYRKIVPHIQNKYAFSERPQYGIVVQNSNAAKVQLDPSNFLGTVQSHVMLAQLGSDQVFPLEWVKEDLQCVRASQGRMPTQAGVYYIEILHAPTTPGEDGWFVVDPLLTATNEPVLQFQTGLEREGQLQATPLDGTLRLYLDNRIQLIEGEEYELGENGAITFLQNFTMGCVISADYRHPTSSTPPIKFRWNTADTTTLPGVVLAFGKRAETGQKTAVVVYEDRVDVAEAFGGKNELSFDLEILARDPMQCEEIADLVNMYLWAEKKAHLEWEGIEILDVSLGGESEEAIDETGQNFQYISSVSVQMRADWEVHVPLPLVISRMEQEISHVESALYFQAYPVLAGRNPDFERIG